MLLVNVEGPGAALEVMRAGLEFAESRGLTDAADNLKSGLLEVLAKVGELDRALELAADIAVRLGSEDVVASGIARAAEARIHALRGQTARVAGELDGLESSGREVGTVDFLVAGLASAAFARATLGDDRRAADLLAEVEANTGARDTPNYAFFLPTMVFTALAVGDPELAAQLVSGFEPTTPYAELVVDASRAALAEAAGDLEAACDGYAEAASGWQAFGVAPEQAYALLGQGRCLAGLDRPAEAAAALVRARAILESLGAAPALAATDALLASVSARA